MTLAALCSAVANDFMLASLLSAGPLCDTRLERQLTETRRSALFGARIELPRLAHIASQCFINEYAWFETEDESERVAALAQAGPRDVAEALTLACYRPLGRFADRIDTSGWPPMARYIWDQQVTAPEQERRHAETLPAITPIAAGASAAVQAQYEANPYPRWVTARAVPRPDASPADVLVAGCGTGRTAILQALINPNAQVLAVDLSRASLAYAARMAKEAGARNITFAQGDILELGRLDRTFDIIECTGVLHHMDSPERGLAVLAALVKPRGQLMLALYSELARRSLGPAKRLAAGYEPSPPGIRALRRRIMDAPEGAPERAALGVGDFFAVSACRDLLMHVCERTYRAEELQGFLASAGLAFGQFLVPEPVRRAFIDRFDAEAISDLALWSEYEAEHPETFLGMYTFTARKPGT